MALAAKAELGAAKLRALADKGCHGCDQLAACEQGGVEPFVPAPRKNHSGDKIFPEARFAYDADADLYRCPAGHALTRREPYQTDGHDVIRYHSPDACRAGPLRCQCTPSKYRIMVRAVNELAMERTAARVAAHPETLAQRKTIAEHVFGALRHWGHDTFLMRGLHKVQAEFSLSALAYNLRRLLNLVRMEKLLAAV